MDALSGKMNEIAFGERQLRMEGASQRTIDDFKEQKRREIYGMQGGQTALTCLLGPEHTDEDTGIAKIGGGAHGGHGDEAQAGIPDLGLDRL